MRGQGEDVCARKDPVDFPMERSFVRAVCVEEMTTSV